MTSGAAEPLRSDARRNVRAIVDAAARALAENPGTPMAEIADAAGVHRATLYRHFPAREDLIAALHRRAFEEADEAVRAARLEEGTAVEALGRAVEALAGVGDRYRMLVHETGKDPRMKDREDALGARLVALVERGQREGDLRPDLDPLWMLQAMIGVLMAGLQRVAEGTLDAAAVPGLVMSMLLDGVRGR